ncbi:MAG: hypothetical protein NTZ39_05660, partial [Methanoregula sp.]|nr:hypothetical protein [Methanoregula sp.]
LHTGQGIAVQHRGDSRVISCPVCSLFACLLAEGTGSVVQVERCTVHAENGSVIAVFSLLS